MNDQRFIVKLEKPETQQVSYLRQFLGGWDGDIDETTDETKAKVLYGSHAADSMVNYLKARGFKPVLITIQTQEDNATMQA